MEKESLKSVNLKRFTRGNKQNEIKVKEAIFLVLCTLVEIGYPFYFLVSQYKMEFPYNILFLFGTIAALFMVFMDLKSFFQSNYIDLLYFQVRVYVVLMIVSLVLFWTFRLDMAEAFDYASDPLTIGTITIICYIIFLIGSFVCVAIEDCVFVFILRLIASIFRIDTQNSYMEKFQSAQTIEGSEEYTRKILKSQYENRFQESSIDEKSFEKYYYERRKKEQAETIEENQEGLFEHTKHFKMITNMNQVDSRYEMLMKIYMPQGGANYVPEICKEIKKEYEEIKGENAR